MKEWISETPNTLSREKREQLRKLLAKENSEELGAAERAQLERWIGETPASPTLSEVKKEVPRDKKSYEGDMTIETEGQAKWRIRGERIASIHTETEKEAQQRIQEERAGGVVRDQEEAMWRAYAAAKKQAERPISEKGVELKAEELPAEFRSRRHSEDRGWEGGEAEVAPRKGFFQRNIGRLAGMFTKRSETLDSLSQKTPERLKEFLENTKEQEVHSENKEQSAHPDEALPERSDAARMLGWLRGRGADLGQQAVERAISTKVKYDTFSPKTKAWIGIGIIGAAAFGMGARVLAAGGSGSSMGLTEYILHSWLGDADAADRALSAEIDATAEPFSDSEKHIVQKGETVWGIVREKLESMGRLAGLSEKEQAILVREETGHISGARDIGAIQPGDKLDLSAVGAGESARSAPVSTEHIGAEAVNPEDVREETAARIEKAMTDMYGYKGFLGTGLFGVSGHDTLAYHSLAGREVAEVMAKTQFGAVPEGGFAEQFGIESKQDVEKMQAYLSSLMQESAVRPKNHETVQAFIERANELVARRERSG